MKKFIFLVIMLITTFSCGVRPEKVVETFLTDVKEKKVDDAMKLTTNPCLLYTSPSPRDRG